MLRVLLFIVAVAILGLGFAFLADTPGTLVATVDGREITVSLMVAAVALVAAVGLVMLTWWIIKVVFTSPQRMQRFFRARRRDRGYQSLSTGIIAAGAGDSVTARKMLKQAGGLLNSTTEPMIQLLDAQASIVEGHHAEAREKFEAMLEDPELRIFGLRGLYMEAKRLGDRDATSGLGLGLSVAQGLTVVMGGELTAEDTPGGGLTVVVSLPAAPVGVAR